MRLIAGMLRRVAEQSLAPLSSIAALAGLSRDRVYELFRLRGAPQPAGHVACLPVYDVEVALRFVRGDAAAQPHCGAEL